MIAASRIPALFLTLAISAAAAQPAAPKPTTDTAASAKSTSNLQRDQCDAEMAGPTQTFYLKNAVQTADANEIVAAIRNMANPCAKIYLVNTQQAIVVHASTEDLALVQRTLNDLDRPKKTYRLTYTVSEVDGTKIVGTQHYSMVVVAGQQTQLKQGSKVPVATGSYDASGSKSTPSVQTQFTYVDVGMNFGVTLDDFANGVRLNTEVAESSVAEQQSGVGTQDPIIRQTSLKSAAFLTPGKPLMLGSVDIPDTTRHLDIEVTMNQLP